jgi:hypothetical protein
MLPNTVEQRSNMVQCDGTQPTKTTGSMIVRMWSLFAGRTKIPLHAGQASHSMVGPSIRVIRPKVGTLALLRHWHQRRAHQQPINKSFSSLTPVHKRKEEAEGWKGWPRNNEPPTSYRRTMMIHQSRRSIESDNNECGRRTFHPPTLSPTPGLAVPR